MEKLWKALTARLLQIGGVVLSAWRLRHANWEANYSKLGIRNLLKNDRSKIHSNSTRMVPRSGLKMILEIGLLQAQKFMYNVFKNPSNGPKGCGKHYLRVLCEFMYTSARRKDHARSCPAFPERGARRIPPKWCSYWSPKNTTLAETLWKALNVFWKTAARLLQ